MARPPRVQIGPKPEGEVRQSQLVTTFGPGSMLVASRGCATRSSSAFTRAGHELSHEAFRAPPIATQDEPAKNVGVPVVEFPGWFVCQNPDCRALLRKDGLESKSGRWVHRCAGSKASASTVSARFLAACKRGHCEDFPWIRFVHECQEMPRCAAPRLTLHEGATGDFSECAARAACR